MVIMKNATVIDGTGAKPVPSSTIILNGNRIESAGSGIIEPSGAEIVIDLHGKTVMPGFIDAHVHLGGTDGFDYPGIGSRHETYDFLVSRTNALKWGITTIRSAGDYSPEIFEFRVEVESGRHISPRIVASGKMIQAKGGHPISTVFGGNVAIAENACVLVDENTDLNAEVKALVDAGADWIKTVICEVDKLDYPKRVPRIPPEKIKRIIELAHDYGKPCMVHVDNVSQMREAVLSGADSIEHILSVGSTDTDIDEDLIELLVEKQTYVVPTIYSIKAHENPQGGKPPVYEKLLLQVNKLVTAGVNVCAGTDASIPLVSLGESFHEELSELVKCGMTPLDAIKAATYGNAKLLRKDKELGAVLPGYMADLVIVDGDPATDIAQTKNILYVIANGRIVADNAK